MTALEPAVLAETERVVAARWQMGDLSDASQPGAWEQLRARLALRIAELLRQNRHKLMTALYVLDVPEMHYRAAMAQPDSQLQAEALAEAVLRREAQRVAARRRYQAHAGPGAAGPGADVDRRAGT